MNITVKLHHQCRGFRTRALCRCVGVAASRAMWFFTGCGAVLQAGLTLINAVFTYRQRGVRFTEGLYDAWQKYQRSLAQEPREAGAAAAKQGDNSQAAREARLARAAAVAEGIHGAHIGGVPVRRRGSMRGLCCAVACMMHLLLLCTTIVVHMVWIRPVQV